jgi:glycosyltransferase involved in cell wall biosynthesis
MKDSYFLYVSRYHKPKRQDLLIKAWRVFQAKNPDEILVFAGCIEDQEYFDRLRSMARGLRIAFMVNVSEDVLKKLYANCKATVFIPFVEDFGITPFESVMYQKPLIASNRGGFVELLKDYPLYFPIIERGTTLLMINEIKLALEKFIAYDVSGLLMLKEMILKGKDYKVKILDAKDLCNFVSEIDTYLKNENEHKRVKRKRNRRL